MEDIQYEVKLPVITDELIDLISEQFNIERNKINKDSKLVEDLNLDSLDTVELAMAAEDKFGVEISDEIAERINTVNDYAKYIVRNL